MSSFDFCLIAVLALWALGSLLFVFRIPRLHSVLARFNRSRVFVHWELFSPSHTALRPGTFEVIYRDRDGEGNVTAWRAGASGFCWAWHAFIWLPERVVATAVQNLGREIISYVRRQPPASRLADRDARILEAYLGRQQPLLPGVVREIRLVRRFESEASLEECVLRFSASPHAAGE